MDQGRGSQYPPRLILRESSQLSTQPRELRPCEAPFAALRIERDIEFLKIPTKPLIGTGERKCRRFASAVEPVMKLSGVRPSQRSIKSACWQVVSLRFAMPVSVDALIG